MHKTRIVLIPRWTFGPVPEFSVRYYCPEDPIDHGAILGSYGNLETAEHYAKQRGEYTPELNLLNVEAY